MRAAENFPLPGGHRDRGIFSVYLLNLVHLQPGQGTFQPAGVLHAYLEGVNVELMANSDNVLRGGLTTKHVDVPELLNILTFEGGTPEVFDGHQVSAQERVYRTPAEEFELSRIALPAHGRYAGEATYGPKALLVLHGSATLTAAEPGRIAGAGVDRSRAERYGICTGDAGRRPGGLPGWPSPSCPWAPLSKAACRK